MLSGCGHASRYRFGVYAPVFSTEVLSAKFVADRCHHCACVAAAKIQAIFPPENAF